MPATMMRGVVWLANTVSASRMVLGTSSLRGSWSAGCAIRLLLGSASAGLWLEVAECAAATGAADGVSAGGEGMVDSRAISATLLGQAEQDVRTVNR